MFSRLILGVVTKVYAFFSSSNHELKISGSYCVCKLYPEKVVQKIGGRGGSNSLPFAFILSQIVNSNNEIFAQP